MVTKLIEIVTVFSAKVMEAYLPAYFHWLTEKLNDTEPFMVLMGAIMIIFVLVVYLWFRNRDA